MIAILKSIGRNFLTIALVIFALIVGGYISGTVETVREFFFPQSAAYVQSTHVIMHGIRGISQLVTIDGELSTTDVKVEIHQGFLNAGYYSANHIAIGAIQAGIEFDKIDEDNISFRDDTYFVTLPAPIITSCRIDHIDQNQQSFTLLTADWDMVRQLAQHDAIIQFAEETIEAGILDRAEKEAEIQIGDFVTELTGKSTSVEFASRDGELQLPLSCKPITPSGWIKDGDGAWKRAS